MGLSGCWRSLPSAVHLSRSHPALDKDMHVRTTTDSEQTSLCSTPSRRLAYDVTPKAYPSIPLGCGRPLASFERKVLLLKANLRRKFQLLPVRYYAVYDSSSAYQVTSDSAPSCLDAALKYPILGHSQWCINNSKPSAQLVTVLSPVNSTKLTKAYNA